MAKKNAAAIDLWSQVFSRAAADPLATVMDPDYDEADDRARNRAAMITAGWSSAEIDAIEKAQRTRRALAPTSSPGGNRDVEALLGHLTGDVEAAMERLGLHSHQRVALGVEPSAGPLVAKVGVIMTDQSIVTVSSFFFRFCCLIARAFTRTLRLNPWLWETHDYTKEEAAALLQRNQDAVSYWVHIYFAFATTGTHIGVPFKPSSRDEVLLMEQVARAMEIFAISHEYGHHNYGHGKDIEADPRCQEFAADQFALRLCGEVDRRPVMLENPYLVSGAGGAILLMALETLRLIESSLGAPRGRVGTHPHCSERIGRFDSVKLLEPAEFKRLKGFRVASTRIMTLIQETVTSPLARMPEAEKARIRLLRERMRTTIS